LSASTSALRPRAPVDLEVQLLADRRQQLERRQPRIEHQRHVRAFRQLLEQQPRERGLARADLAGELHEPAAAALADAEQQVRERVAVALRQEHEARIGRDRERWFLEAVELEVHRVL
jgi:hypothetical protein